MRKKVLTEYENPKAWDRVRELCQQIESGQLDNKIPEIMDEINNFTPPTETLYLWVNCYEESCDMDRELMKSLKKRINQLKLNENMNKNKIRLTESQLHNVIKESVKRILKESSFPNYRQLINITGINDNDEWNAAAMAEEREELEGKIWRTISKKLCNGGNPREVAFHFTDLVKLMDKFGFKYEGNDDSHETVKFSGSYGEFVVCPATYYPKMDLLRISNIYLS